MPIYEYQCKKCSHQLEKLQKMSDDPLKECPECHESSLRKLVSAAAFKLKGTGWYETDFKDKKPNKADEKSSDKGTDKKDKAESKKEVKKEKKTTSSSGSSSS